MSKILKNILLLLLIVLVLFSIGYVGLMVYGNVTNFGEITSTVLPELSKAPFQVYIEATRNIIFTDSYTETGEIITIHGFYGNVKGKYRYNPGTLILDKSIFGNIEIKKREE